MTETTFEEMRDTSGALVGINELSFKEERDVKNGPPQ